MIMQLVLQLYLCAVSSRPTSYNILTANNFDSHHFSAKWMKTG
jgi:hypothetical protein